MTSGEQWRVVSIKDVCEAIVDCVNKTAPTVEHETPYKMIRTSNVKGGWVELDDVKFVEADVFAKWNRRATPKQGDVVLTREAPLGEVGMIRTRDRVFLGQRLVLYRADPEKLDNRFLLAAFQSDYVQGQIKSLGSGATVEHMRVPDAEKLTIKLPPLTIQQRIGEILSAYDDLIENNTRRIKILEQVAQMLYREWFVNYRFPGHEKVGMMESELGQIPQGWSLRKLGEVLSLEYGKALKAEQRSGGAIPVFGSSGIVGYHSERLAHGPGIVVGRKGNVGSVFFCDCDFWVIDTAYYVSTSLPLHFVYFNLLTQNFLNNDAAVPGLNRNQAHSLPAVIPDANTLQTFESHVEHMFKLKTCLEKINSNLRTTRDLLLPKLVSGEISVEQIESEIAAQTV
jgi:type I restriction enzyme S subunit